MIALAPRPRLDLALLDLQAQIEDQVRVIVRASRIKQAVRERQAERRQALKELQNELDA